MDIVADIIYILTRVLMIAIIARAAMSWFSPRPDNPIVSFVHEVTEPILAPLRRIIPLIGMFDITPIVAIILLEAFNYFVQRLVA